MARSYQLDTPRESVRIEVCVYRTRRPRDRFFRRQPVAFFRRTVDTNSFLSIVRVASIAHRLAGIHSPVGRPVRPSARFLPFTLVHARFGRRACTRDRAATLPSNQQKPATACSTGRAPFPGIIMKKRWLQYFAVSGLLNPW